MDLINTDSNMSEVEFRMMIIKALAGLEEVMKMLENPFPEK